MNSLLLFVLCAAIGIGNTLPTFSDFPATEGLHGRMALPRITNAQEREFRTELHRAITKGYDVVEGGTEHERHGPNFGGHYVLVQWGCGTSCMYGALIDANTGQVLRLPHIPGAEQTGFHIPTVDLQSLRFRTNSLLLGVDNVSDSQTYYYVLEPKGWRFLKKLPTPDN
jgi:hypothetical protein